MEQDKIIKMVALVSVLFLSIWAFMRGDVVFGVIGLAILFVLVYFFFLQDVIKREPMDLIEMVKIAKTYLEDEFKISVEDGEGFRLYGHREHGSEKYKMVFQHQDEETAETHYYPVTMNRFTGKFSDATGVIYNTINLAEHFLQDDGKPGRGTGTQSMAEVQEMFESTTQRLEDRIDRIRSGQKEDSYE